MLTAWLLFHLSSYAYLDQILKKSPKNCTLPNYDTGIIIVPIVNVCREAYLEGTIKTILGIPVVEWYASSDKSWLSS